MKSFAFVKKNVCNESEPMLVLDISHEMQWPVGDASFAPNPTGTAEDDGVLLINYVDGQAPNGDATSYLMVVDAVTMKPFAKIYTPTSRWWMPYGFHGLWA